jgi:hypothetical protein
MGSGGRRARRVAYSLRREAVAAAAPAWLFGLLQGLTRPALLAVSRPLPAAIGQASPPEAEVKEAFDRLIAFLKQHLT